MQNGIPHCCVINVKALILRWLDEVIQARKSSLWIVRCEDRHAQGMDRLRSLLFDRAEG